jgi:secondary thiamine-phosphate synthase enzyme
MVIAVDVARMNSDFRSSTDSSVFDMAPVVFDPVPTPRSHSVARVTHRVLTLRTSTRLELFNLTSQVQDAVRAARVGEGLVLVSSMHTTFALMVNEWQEALLEDIKGMLASVVPADREYHHNDPKQSDCDRKNAHSHLQATLLGHSLSFGVMDGKLQTGQFQAIIGAELDGPRERQVTVQIFSFA